jgi:2-desacetyl-2-hydroxyethyl bacteriochlorophyllide A dehydrogenase
MNAKDMRAVVVAAERKIELRDVPVPEPLPGEVLIRIETCLLCTWEQRIFAGSGASLPIVPGHEASGVITSIPAGTVTSFKVGDKVVFKTLDHCGHCSFCYEGDTNQCVGAARKRLYGGIPGTGGLAEYIALDVSKVFLLDPGIDLSVAAFAEPIACCLHSVERAHLALGDTVVIVGMGIMGQLHALLSRMRGCRVVVIEPDARRRELALSLGAHVGIDPRERDPAEAVRELTRGEGAEAVFSTVTKSSVAAAALGMVRKMGTLVFYGSFHPNDPIQLDPNAIHYKEFVITGSYSPSTRDFFRSARLLSEGLLDPRPFLSARFPMDRAQEAFEAAIKPENFRVAIDLRGR